MNQPPGILKIALLFLVLAGIGVWAWRGFMPQAGISTSNDAPVANSTAPPEPEHLVLVTYFTSDQRCPTCVKIEKLTREAVESGFPKELGRGEVRFQTVNFDRPGNKHFIKDYGLSFKTVVVSNRRLGKEMKWDKFDKVWDLVGEPEAFASYLQEGIRKHIKQDSDA